MITIFSHFWCINVSSLQSSTIARNIWVEMTTIISITASTPRGNRISCRRRMSRVRYFKVHTLRAPLLPQTFFFSRGNTIINARRSGVRSHAVLLVRDDRRLVRLRVLLPPHVVRAIAHQGKLAQKKEFVCCLQFKKGSVTLMYEL